MKFIILGDIHGNIQALKECMKIIEKINGQSVYYHCYKMSETEREKFIENLINVIKQIHYREQKRYNWSEK